jgi:hypothetical protein
MKVNIKNYNNFSQILLEYTKREKNQKIWPRHWMKTKIDTLKCFSKTFRPNFLSLHFTVHQLYVNYKEKCILSLKKVEKICKFKQVQVIFLQKSL